MDNSVDHDFKDDSAPSTPRERPPLISTEKPKKGARLTYTEM
jgi:hypothetical protein